jgi:hypothetical protein
MDMDTITMTCHTCGMILKVPGNSTEFSCWYCGTCYHPRETNLVGTLSRFSLLEAEQELGRLKTTKVRKLEELGKCLDEIIRLRNGVRQELLARRQRLEEDILRINLSIHTQESTISISRQVTQRGYTGD